MMESSSSASGRETRGSSSRTTKTYVLDTNVLLHDPYCLYKFDDNSLVIPIEALEELDAIKMEQSSERGRNARRVHRLLRELLPDSRVMLEGVRLDSGGTLSVVINNTYKGPRRLRIDSSRSDPFSIWRRRIIALSLRHCSCRKIFLLQRSWSPRT